MSDKSFVPKYCLHKPSGRAYVRIHGKVVCVGRHGTAESKREYARLVAEYASGDHAAPQAPPSASTVVEVADAYWTFDQGYY